MAVFEGYTKLNYGDPDLNDKFDKLIYIMPRTYTMGENVRSLYQSLIFFSALTFEINVPLTISTSNHSI